MPITHHTVITDHEGKQWLSIFSHRGSHVCVEGPPMLDIGKFPPRNVPEDIRIAVIRPSAEHVEDVDITVA